MPRPIAVLRLGAFRRHLYLRPTGNKADVHRDGDRSHRICAKVNGHGELRIYCQLRRDKQNPSIPPEISPRITVDRTTGASPCEPRKRSTTGRISCPSPSREERCDKEHPDVENVPPPEPRHNGKRRQEQLH